MKKLFFTAALSLLAMGVFAQKKVLKSAEKAFKKGAYEEAVALAKQASENPETASNPDVYILLGKVSLQEFANSDFADLDEARASMGYFNQALGFSDENEKEDILAKPFFLPGEEKKPIKERKLAAGGDMMGLLEFYIAEEGNKALDGEDYEKAYPLMELTYMLDSTIIERAFFTAYSAEQAENQEVALKYFKKVLGYDQEYANKSYAYSQVISYSIDKKDYDTALEMIREAKVVYPEEKLFADWEVEVLLQADKMDEALKNLEAIIAAGNGNKQTYYTLSFLYLRNDNWEKAIELSRKAIELDANYIDAYYVLGTGIFNQGADITTEANAEVDDEAKYKALKEKSLEKFREAMPIFERLIADNDKDVFYLRPLSTIYDQLSMDDKRDEILAKLDAIEGN